MNGVHDLGGMQDFGPVVREENEPVFHAPWERVVYAISRAMGYAGINNIDEGRHAIERMDPAEYLGASYYERWLDGRTRLLREKGVITDKELDDRQAFFAEHPDTPAGAILKTPPTAAPPERPVTGAGYVRKAAGSPRFAPGDRVRTRVMQPKGHTRLPRYARGKPGVIERLHGTHVFPDANAHGLGEQPQPLYSVRFDAVELWGETAEPNQTVNIDLWETYLLPG
ncbi:MAG TPA: nitrile hydratase subunit beta [Dehalococcoidia bacterium]|nr:nitrile hydratase subunit beta [Dehalococcoidia bacterium]